MTVPSERDARKLRRDFRRAIRLLKEALESDPYMFGDADVRWIERMSS